jgi:photosystem II stability/assembly factor-like uncharacterized protein
MKAALGLALGFALLSLGACTASTEVNGGLGTFRPDDDGSFSTVIVGGQNQGAFFSTDLCKTWQSASTLVLRIYGMASSEHYVFAITAASGVFRSSDNGDTWSHINTQFDSTGNSCFASGSIVLLGASRGILRSTDEGDTWTLATTLAQGVLGFTHIGNTIFAATTSQGVARSTDNGETWDVSNGAFGGSSITGIGTDGTLVYATSNGSAVFRSSDRGDSWQRLGFNCPVSYGLTWSKNALYGGTTSGLARSVDSGVTWESIQDIPSLIYRPLARNNYIFAASYARGMFLSSDYGSTWQQMNNGLTDSIFLASAVH